MNADFLQHQTVTSVNDSGPVKLVLLQQYKFFSRVRAYAIFAKNQGNGDIRSQNNCAGNIRKFHTSAHL